MSVTPIPANLDKCEILTMRPPARNQYGLKISLFPTCVNGYWKIHQDYAEGKKPQIKELRNRAYISPEAIPGKFIRPYHHG